MSDITEKYSSGIEHNDIELFGFPTSPYTMKVAGYLEYKQLNYRFTGVNPISYREVRFSDVRQVPILKIGEDWLADSDDIALWLDDVFPQRPLLPYSTNTKSTILDINSWINHAVIPCMFRLSVDWPSIGSGLSNGWKLGNSVHRTARIPFWCRLLWPLLVQRAGFVNNIVNTLDRSEPLIDLQQRLVHDFSEKLGNGPYLGSQTRPSLADVTLYPLVIFGHALGLRQDIPWREEPKVGAWTEQMTPFFRQTPYLVPLQHSDDN